MNHPDADQYREKSAKKVTVGRKGGSVSEEEVAYIERRMAEGARPCVIAREMNRHDSTVGRYVKLIREGVQLSSK
jgi:IS30 family transposase